MLAFQESQRARSAHSEKPEHSTHDPVLQRYRRGVQRLACS